MEPTPPTSAHEKLALFAGEWTGEETCHPSPWNDTLYTAPSRIRARLGLDGVFAFVDHEQTVDGGVPYRVHAVYGYGSREDRYVGYWFDSTGAPPTPLRGQFTGDVLSLTAVVPALGHVMLTCDLSEAAQGVHRLTLATSYEGEVWQPLMEGRYQRV